MSPSPSTSTTTSTTHHQPLPPPSTIITPQNFASALRDLPLSTLSLKAAELRNSIAHLEYSNEQLRPFAYPASSSEDEDVDEDVQPDPICVEAIVENEIVIARMEERIGLVRREVERRGVGWEHISGGDGSGVSGERERERERERDGLGDGVGGGGGTPPILGSRSGVGLPGERGSDGVGGGGGSPAAAGSVIGGRSTNGTSGTGGSSTVHPAWTDGTFTTGTISIGDGGLVNDGTREGGQRQIRGGRLGDEELRRRLEERMTVDLGDEDGMHL